MQNSSAIADCRGPLPHLLTRGFAVVNQDVLVMGFSELSLYCPQELSIGEDGAVASADKHREASFVGDRGEFGNSVAILNRDGTAHAIPTKTLDEEMLESVLSQGSLNFTHLFTHCSRNVALAVAREGI